jgi:hypothetical protein
MNTEYQVMTPAKMQALEARVAQCESQLSACRATRAAAEKAVKEGKLRLRAISMEVLQ